MMAIEEGFDVFVHDGDKAFGAVRLVSGDGIMVYVENAGDFAVPMRAVKEVQAGKVVLDSSHLDPKLRQAIARAHSGEDPRI
jgi:hypothetical protein